MLSLIYLFYFAKNLIISGCLIYPVESLCFAKLPWYEIQSIKTLNFNLEVFNKSFFQYNGDLTQGEYIKNFHWIETWIKRNANELIEFSTLLILIFIITILNFKKSINKNFNIKIITLFPLIITFIFTLLLIFLKTPVIASKKIKKIIQFTNEYPKFFN